MLEEGAKCAGYYVSLTTIDVARDQTALESTYLSARACQLYDVRAVPSTIPLSSLVLK